MLMLMVRFVLLFKLRMKYETNPDDAVVRLGTSESIP